MFNKSELGLLIFGLIVNLVSNYYKPDILSLLGVLSLSLVIGIDLGIKITNNENKED